MSQENYEGYRNSSWFIKKSVYDIIVLLLCLENNSAIVVKLYIKTLTALVINELDLFRVF